MKRFAFILLLLPLVCAADVMQFLPFMQARTTASGLTNVTANLVAWYRMDQTNGATTADSSGFGNTGLISVGTLAPGTISNALSFVATGYMHSTNQIEFGLPLPTDFNATNVSCTGLAWDSTSNCYVVGKFSTNVLLNTLIGVSTNSAKLYEIPVYSNIVSGIQGVAYDSSDDTFWYVDFEGTNVNHYQRDGTFINAFPVVKANGLAYNVGADEIWVGYLATVTRYAAATGNLLGTITLTGPANVDGITVDPDDETIWATGGSGNSGVIYHMDASGGALSSFSAIPEIEHITVINGKVTVTSDMLFHGGTPQGNRIHSFNKNGLPDNTFVWTLAAWVWPKNLAAGNQAIIDNFRSATETAPVFSMFFRSTGQLSAGCNATASNSTNGLVTTNGWQHLAASYEASSQAVKLYKDGILCASNTMTIGTFRGLETNWFAARAAATLRMNGLLDDARIYKRVLSLAELQLLHQAGTNGVTYP